MDRVQRLDDGAVVYAFRGDIGVDVGVLTKRMGTFESMLARAAEGDRSLF
ncbi:hypothetical protein [Nocardia noduli]|nr:hypothetical protein [Nocardia noduli]